MGASIPDEEFEKYAPKRFREQPRMPPAEPLREQPRMPSAEPLRVTPAPVAPLSTDTYVERRTGIEFDPRPERVPEPPPRSDDRSSSLFVRFAPLFFFAAIVGLARLDKSKANGGHCGKFYDFRPSVGDGIYRQVGGGIFTN